MIERIYVAAPYSPKCYELHNIPLPFFASEVRACPDNIHSSCLNFFITNSLSEVQQNVDRAIAAGNVIHDKGHYAFVPHLTHYLHIHYSCKVDRGVWYYDYDNTFLDHWATSFLYLAPSYGADKELDRAKKLGLKIYYNLDEIQEV